MKDFLRYVFSEMKSGRLSRNEAFTILQQFQGKQRQRKVLHPLLHANTSSLTEQRFSTRFSGQEFFLADHQVQGRKVLPGAAQLEMARAAVAQALELDEAQGRSVQLRQVVFARPVIVGEGGLELHIGLCIEEDGAITYEIYSLAGEEEIAHGQGRAFVAEAAAVPVPVLDAAALYAAAAHRTEGAQCYEAFAGIGLAYGPAFQGLRYVAAGEDAQGPFVVADIVLPQVVASTQRHYGLHPSLIDTALQSCMGMMLGSLENAPLALPFAIEQLALLRALPAKGHAVVRNTAGHNNQSVQKLDIVIADEQGQVCATIQGFSSRVLPGAGLAEASASAVKSTQPASLTTSVPAELEEKGAEAVGELTLVPVWEVTEPEWTASWPQADQAVALIGGSPAQQQALQGRYPQVRILPIGAGDSIETITATLQSGPLPEHLFWLLPAGEDDAGSADLIAAQHQGVLLGLRLLKALLALGVERQALGWTVVTERAQAASGSEVVAPAHASVHGFIGALAKEYPRWALRLVDIEDGGSLPLDALLRLPPNGQGNAWRYRLGQWQQQKLIQAQLEAIGTPWRQNGVYVILGGAGGIGEVLSEHLIRHHQAQMIWIGRRALDETIDAKSQRLAVFGPRPHYLRADATDAAALQAALAEIVARHGHIDGLINATIVLKDQPLARMDEADFAAALAAKVDVSVNVARVFREAVRDFVLVFSSLQSSVKAHGQSNYAAGCTFADAHAHALRAQWPCPVKVVNWGYWGSVGIVADEQTRQRMAKFGMESIEPPEAMQVLDKLLVSPVDQIAFVKTSKPEVALSLGLLPGQRITVTHPTQATTPPQPSTLPLPLDEQGRQQVQALEAQLAALLHARLHELGLCREGKELDLANWKQGIALPKLYERWLDQSLQMLVQYGHLKQQGDVLIGGPDPDSATLWQGWEQAKAESAGNPQQQAQLALLDAMLQALPAILRGQTSATQAMFPNASMALVENIYKNNRIADYFNAVLADSLIDHIEQRLAHDPQARLRLLEIGAGTGGTSAKLFERLAPYADRIEQYAYTDISKAFLLHAQKHYAHQAPYLHTQLFNVEAPLAGQDIAAGSYDIVIATNVLHATKDMRRTLRNTKALLKREGLLLVNEVATSSLFTHLTFGLLEGWWLYDDAALRIAGSPALAPATWQSLLQAEGFNRISYPAEAAHPLGQQVIAAVSNGVVRQERSAATVAKTPASPAQPAAATRVTPAAISTALATSSDSLRDKAIGYLKTLVAQTLKMSAGDLDANESWAVYGIDSILGMQVTDALGKVFADIDSTLLFEHQSIGALADHLVATQPDTLVRLLGLDTAPAAEVRTPAQADAPSLPTVSPATLRRNRRFLPVQTGTANPAGSGQVAPALKDIAIIGLSGRYPNARNLDAYWKNLLEGINCIREIPKQRWDWQAYHAADKNQMQWGRIYSKWGGFLDDIDCFDPLFFGISPREAERMIPQERLFLEEAYACLNDAGYTPATLSAQRQVGVFVGIMNSHYGTAPSYWSVANRVSYLFGFNGPSLAVDTACSSSLTAIHLALESLSTGGIDCAIAGGVNLIIDPVQYMGLSAMTMLSSGDACRSFGAQADGFVDAEGVGAVLLKPLAKAIEDGDRIYGVIKGSTLNHGGKTNGYTVPNPKAQGDLIAQALKESGIHPRTISYIEAHGTGTALGDPIEIAGLGKAFSAWTGDTGYCAIGSAKSNIGHCESAAGIAGLTKVLLQMQHQTLVKSLHSEELNPNIDFGKTPFVVQRETAAWKRPRVKLEQDGEEREYPRRAGISSFGAGGANAHLIIEEYAGPEQPRIAVTQQQPVVIVLSAKNEERLQEQAKQLLASLERYTDSDLADIAYTLQVGREAMEARLACIVSDLSMLKDKLGQYLRGKSSIEGLHLGEAKRGKDALSVFSGDEELHEAAAKWMERGKLSKLVDLWIKGFSLDWNKLYGTHKPRRVALASYPFARERYWLPDAQRFAHPDTKVAAALHPLVHRNTSSLSEQRFSTKLSGEEFFLRDHVVQGRRILPAAAQLEMARAAVVQALELDDVQGGRIVLHDVVFARPVVVDEQGLGLHIGLTAEDDGTVGYEIYSGQGEEAVVHGQGRAAVAEELSSSMLDVPVLQAACTRRTDAQQCYDAFAQRGLAYGPGFQGLQQVHAGQDGQGAFALASIALPQAVADTQGPYVLHPSLIDAALQSSIGLMDDVPAGQLALPFAVGQVRLLSALPDRGWVLVRQGNDSSTAVQKLDIAIADEQGKVCVVLSGFSSRVFKPVAEVGEVKTVLMQPRWITHEVSADAVTYESHSIVLCELPELETTLAATLPQAQVLRLGSEHMTLAERYTDYAAQLLAHMQQLAAGKPQGEMLIQLVVPTEGEGVVLRGLGGLLKSAALESPKLLGQVLMLPEQSGQAMVERIASNAAAGAGEIRYEGNARQQWQLQPVTAGAAVQPWKDGGVYLITGGAGGLGLIFAQAIATQAKGATLVLTGRSALDEGKEATLDVLRSLGAHVDYRRADIGNAEAVRELVAHIRERHGKVNGVLHSAGVLRDSFLVRKTEQELRDVFTPKVAGLLHLDVATQDMELDHFIVFGSSAGVLGNVGQADYAAANAFMDAYAAYRNELVAQGERKGRTLSVDWPLWAEGGMQVDAGTRERLWRTTGLAPMESDAGVQALRQALSLNYAQVAVFSGDAARIARMTQPAERKVVQPAVTVSEQSAVIAPDLKARTTHYLTTLLSKALKLPAHRIDAQAALEQYGIDSVMIMDLSQVLENAFGPLSKTLFFEYQSIDALAGYFVQQHPQQLTRLLGLDQPVGQQTQGQAIAAVPQLAPTPKRKGKRFQPAAPQRPQGALDIAIVGVSGRYPNAPDLDAYWTNLTQGIDCIREIPSDRWDHSRYFDSQRGQLGKSYSKWGGFIDGIDQFDPLFFNISPREAGVMDPQERLFLQCVYHTLEDAGYTRDSLARQHTGESKVGVFVGVMYEEYQLYGAQAQALGQGFALTGNAASIANRVSYWCNFHGPSLAVDTMCSSSLTAIHLACQSIMRGECEAAIAGGVNVTVHPNKYLLLSQGQFTSSEGLCRSFGQGGDGYVPGEGVGAVLLKPLAKAIEDGDRIYGVIKGSTLNHGGKTNGYTVPNPKAQGELITQALKESGIHPRTISYIEAHGTGTALGDPIEIAGLGKAFGSWTSDTGYCAIGSAKSNIGHCESAAGIAGLTKVLLQMQHQTLVKSLHSEELNPNIDFGKTPFVVQRETAAWKRPLVKLDQDREEREYPRRAGLSSFGAGGANAHLIVEEYTGPEQPRLAVTAQQPAVIVLSAKNEERLQEQAQQLLTALERHSDHDLADIAYTLQVGREAMDARLACLVSDLSMLKDKLTRYLAGETGIEDCYQGEVRRNREALSAFAADEDMQQTIAAWISKRKLGKLADLWAKGLVLDWSALYGDIKPRRISLPTYPFAKERYWIEDMRAAAAQAVTVSSGFTALHPLLHANTSELTEQRFTSVFSGEEFFLKDHQVQGRKILPAAAHLELAREAVVRALGLHRDSQSKHHVQLERIVFARPVAMGTSPLELHIALSQQDDGSVQYEIYSEEGETTVVHGQGVASLAQESQSATLELAALQARCERVLGAEECYDAFAQLGLAYGPGFQGVQQVQMGQDAQGTFALATVRLPQTVANTHAHYVLHPSLIDAALQSCAGLVGGAGLQGRQLALPFALERVTMAAPLPEKCRVLVRPSTGSEPNASVQKLDIAIADEQGKVCVVLSGFSSRVFKPVAEAGEVKTVLTQPQWVEQELPAGDAIYESHSIVLCELPELETALAATLPQAQVLRLGSEHTTLAERYTDYAAQLLSHVQQLLASKPQGEVLVQLVVPAEGEGVVLRGLGGLLKSAALESPKLLGQVLMLPEQSGQAMVERIASNAAAGAGEIRYEGNARQQWQLQPVTAGAAVQPWKDGGVYLITGGAGGLGLIFAQAIATQAKGATLVLTGRSALDEGKEATLDVLRSLGAHVDYRRADIGNAEAVRELVAHIRERHGKVNGVLHSAGVLRDSFLVRKTEQELRDVFTPKVAGLLHLDAATQDMELDHFIVFGSSAGVLGNVGQADYAAANAFMDAYASWRNHLVEQGERRGKTLSVDWPLWAEGGMQVDAATRERLWRTTGLAPMESDAGVQALRQALSLNYAQVAVFSGDAARIARMTQPVARKVTQPAVSEQNVEISHGFEFAELKSRVESAIAASISDILKISPDDLDTGTELSEFGFDSISLTTFGNDLNQKYELDLTPTVFFEYPTISGLADYLIREYRLALARRFSIAATTAVAATAVPAPVPAESQAVAIPLPETSVPSMRGVARSRRERTGQVTLRSTSTTEPIAIIGMSGCFPEAADIDALWQNLLAGRDCIGDIPATRWNWDVLYGDPHKEANKTNIKRAGLIDGVDRFDPLFFGISPREAEVMDPQQRLLMMHVWKVIEDAGYSAHSLSGSNTGLFIGTGASGYNTLLSMAGETIEGYSAPGMVPSVGPNRMSYLLNLHGPSEPIETACSSALVAVHRALLSMQAGQCEMAIVGGVNTLISPEPHISFSKAGMLSPDGQCKTFSAQANGYVRGEGVGMLMLKKLSAAERDGDTIHAVIRGSAENHGGRANSLTAPNPRAQADLIKAALKQAGIAPGSIGYIEAHGTGTPLGDPIEVQGLHLAFRELAQESGQTLDTAQCGIGSIKTNIGHLELAAGVAGLIKAVLQMRHKTLVKSLHSDEINPYIQLQDSPFYVVQENRPWEAPKDAQGRDLPRRAGVSSFGFGGVNAHVVLEEYVEKTSRERKAVTPQQPAVIVLSAKTEERLQAQAKQLLQALERHENADLADIAYTLQVGREGMEARLACIVPDLATLKDKLGRYLVGETGIDGLYRGEVKRNKEALAVFAADDDLQRAIDAWLARGKLSRLAELWCKGLAFDWNKLYGQGKPQRISLPNYPFAEERYWAPGAGLLTVSEAGSLPARRPAPVFAGQSADPRPALAGTGQSRDRAADTAFLEKLFGDLEKDALSVDGALEVVKKTMFS